MGVRDYLPGIPDDGDPGVHCECRECGTNVEADRDACPVCDGDVVEYEL